MSNVRLVASDGVPLTDAGAVRFALTAIGSSIHLASIPAEGGRVSGCYFGDDVEAATKFAVEANVTRNIYWTPNIASPDCGHKPTKAQIIALRYAFLDCDPPKDGTPFDKIAIVSAVRCDGPTVVIDSGNGVQAFWHFEPIVATRENVAAVEGLNRTIIRRHGGDSSRVNIDSLMRLPGTVNWPSERKRERGCVPCLARVL